MSDSDISHADLHRAVGETLDYLDDFGIEARSTRDVGRGRSDGAVAVATVELVIPLGVLDETPDRSVSPADVNESRENDDPSRAGTPVAPVEDDRDDQGGEAGDESGDTAEDIDDDQDTGRDDDLDEPPETAPGGTGGPESAGDAAEKTEPPVDRQVSPVQHNVLATLGEHDDDVPTPALKSETDLGASIYGTLDALVEKGFIEKRRDPDDGRRTLVKLTDAGADLVDDAVGRDQEDSDGGDAGGQEEQQQDSDALSHGDSGSHDAGDEQSSDDDPTAEDGGEWTDRCGKCDAEFDSTLAYALHRTEVHGVPRNEVGLEPGEFAEQVSDMDSIADLADGLDWGTERVLRTLGMYGLDDAVVGINDLNLGDVTPDWLDEASFHAAVEDSETVEDLACTLGWEHDDLDGLRWLVEFVGVDDQLNAGEDQEVVA
jgi:DNA-binding MarR family transcriptional regulator